MTLLALSEPDCVTYLIERTRRGIGQHVLTVNVDILRRYERDAEYRAALGNDFEAVADGMPLVWASRLSGSPVPERVSGSSILVHLTGAAADAGMRVLLLGGHGDAGQLAAVELARRFPGIDVRWEELGEPFGFTPEELHDVVRRVRDVEPAVIWVSLGSPKGERLIELVRSAAPHSCWISVGAGFDFLAGRVPRAPSFMRALGLEWLFRLGSDPKRLAGRYLRDDAPFALAMLIRAAQRRRRR